MSSNRKDYTKFSKPSLPKELPKPKATIHEKPVEQPKQELIQVIGHVNVNRLNVRKEPNIKADIICEVTSGSELMIEETESTKEWFKVYTASGVEGYCMKKFVDINK